ncbi:hypothetical protein ACFLTP_08775 [Chloroflexota bacterium]
MGLSPEERKRIYEEEKTRIEEERKQEKEKQEAEGTVRRVNDRTEDYPGTGRVGRVTSSSFTIAWSIAFLILFSFFKKYIAYYQYESGEWIRYPVLTVDFYAWLPIITATLIFVIIGHIAIIIFDKYLLRETALIILNLFGIAAVVSLLSIFPFDFHSVPNTVAVNLWPVVATITLFGIAVGLGIATLVSLIRLIASAATGNMRY